MIQKVRSPLIDIGAVTNNTVAVNAVTGDKVDVNAIRGNNIVVGQITGNLIADNSISGNNIVENAIRGNNIVAGTITGNLIGIDAITGNLILNSSITSNKVESNPVFTGNVTANTFYTSNGTLDLPAIAPTSNTKAGIYFPDANSITFVTNGVNQVTLDSRGRFLMPNQIGFGGFYRAANRTTAGNFASYTEFISGYGYNNGNHFDTTTGIFTAPISGKYIFTFQLGRDSDVSGRDILQFRVNGLAFEAIEVFGNYQDIGNSMIVSLAPNDTVVLYYSPVVASSCYALFSGWLLG